MNATHKIGIVVPCYNEAKRIELHFFEQFVLQNINCVFCFVNDGSSDKTLEILEEFTKKNSSNFIVINNKINIGKAETVRNGILFLKSKNQFDVIGFIDADLATPLSEIIHLTKIFEQENEKLIVFGARIIHLGSQINRKFHRFILGRIFASIVGWWILKSPIYDTQCGFKFFKSSVIDKIFSEPFKSKWFFDVELFCRLIQKYPNVDINLLAQEVFVRKWIDVKGSKIKLLDYFKVPFELIKIKYYYKLNKSN
jgi:dolichyl-phosphate beta-glucosyltransferase